MAGGAPSLLLGHQTGWGVVYNSLALIAHHIIDLTIRHGRLKGTYGFGQWPSNAAHHVVILYPRWLLAKQAEAYLAVISRSTEEDKNQPWALFSLQPSRVTGLLYSAWNLWDDHLWWPGCPPFAVMFSMVMMLPLCLGPQNRHPPCDSISLLKVIVDGSIKRGEKYFLLPPLHLPPTQKLYIRSSGELIYVVFFSAGMHQVWTCRFDGDGGDLKRPWYNFCTRGM